MPERRFRKGDRVQFHLGTRTVTGVVREDRGPIGVGGRRLYAVEFPADTNGRAAAPSVPSDHAPSLIELPADQLHPPKAA